MREPKYGQPFPKSEYVDRIKRIRKSMTSAGLDAVILARQENLEYSSGFTHASWLAGFRDFQTIQTGRTIRPIAREPDSRREMMGIS